MVVVDHEDDPPRLGCELVDDHGPHRVQRRRRTVQRPRHPLADAGLHAIQRLGHIAPEPDRVVVAGVQRQPGHRRIEAPGPVRQQGRLAEPGRGGDQGQLACHPRGQAGKQPGAGHEAGMWAGNVQLGGQQRIPLSDAGGLVLAG
jgi:hypothetical protein